MKRNLGEIWKEKEGSRTIYKVQFPKGIKVFNNNWLTKYVKNYLTQYEHFHLYLGLYESISCLDSNEIFDINFSTKSKNIFCIDKTGVKYVDIIKNSIISV